MPVYNCEKYVAKAIDSILNQTYSNFELIVIDDCSTDGTKHILKSYSDSRIKIIEKPINTGYVESLNLAIGVAKGSYIARMDADDISVPHRFEKQISYLEMNPEVSVVGARILMINEDEKVIGQWQNDSQNIHRNQIRKTMPYRNCICHPSVLIRHAIFDNFKYDINQYGSEDWDLWLDLLRSNYIIGKIDEVLLYYRVTGKSVSSTIDKDFGVWGKANTVRKKFLKKKLKMCDLKPYDFHIALGVIITTLKIFRRSIRKFI